MTTRSLGCLIAAAALTLAACGNDQAASSPGGAGTNDGPVGTRDVPGVGTVLVDTSGHTLYFTDSDQAGTIKCVGDCLSLWHPAKAPDNITGTNLGAVSRPDGSNQLTYQGHPIYTFDLDSQDKPVSGNNATDSFGGVNFTWHAVIVSASDQPTTGGDNGGGGGY